MDQMKTTPLFAETLRGVFTKLDTKEKAIALTLDLCGGRGKGALDQKFVDFLTKENIKATLFVSGRWITHHRKSLKKLASSPLFNIENHGLNHRPASSKPRRAYGIKSTRNLDELYDEILLNSKKIEKITGKRPQYYRSGTAFYDEKAIKLAHALDIKVAGFDIVSGDAAHPDDKEQILTKLRQSKEGSIIIMHLNHASWQSFNAFRDFYEEFKVKNFRFVHLDEFPLK